MELKEFFDTEIAPCVRADGGWLELERKEGGTAVLKAKGECTRCISLDRCLRWAESRVNPLHRRSRSVPVEEVSRWHMSR